jgi:predicted nucleotidyltransferase
VPTTAQQQLIDSILPLATADQRIESAWLTGSMATGVDDEWSDVDVLLVAAEADLDSVVKVWQASIDRIAPTIHVLTLFGRIISAVTSTWERFDLAFAGPAALAARDPGGLKRLFARPGATAPTGIAQAPRTPTPASIEALVREFLRVLGLTPVVIHRNDRVLLLDGLVLLRSLLVDLMLAENGKSRNDSGLKRIGQALTPEQTAVLIALPAFDTDAEHAPEAIRCLAAAFLSRAKALATRLDAPWPETFELATRAHLRRSLALNL